jgi:hypothetical protein
MEYVTIHHIDSMERDLHMELRCGERDQPSIPEFEKCYEPAETILGTSDVDEAFYRAQGANVNRQQNARHMVHSSMPTDVYEVHTGDPEDPVAFFMVLPIGFERIDWGGELPPWHRGARGD